MPPPLHTTAVGGRAPHTGCFKRDHVYSRLYGTRVVTTLTYCKEQNIQPAVMLCGPEELRRRAKMRLCTQVCANSVRSPCKTKPSWFNLPLSIPPTRHKRKHLTTAGSSWLVSPAKRAQTATKLNPGGAKIKRSSPIVPTSFNEPLVHQRPTDTTFCSRGKVKQLSATKRPETQARRAQREASSLSQHQNDTMSLTQRRQTRPPINQFTFQNTRHRDTKKQAHKGYSLAPRPETCAVRDTHRPPAPPCDEPHGPLFRLASKTKRATRTWGLVRY